MAHLRRARDFIDREYARPLDVPAMARRALMSASHFSRRYRDVYSETPYQHLLTRRIERARALLAGTSLSVTEICWAVGFSSLGSFSARFRELTGHSPTEYREKFDRPPGVPDCAVRAYRLPRRSSGFREAVSTG